MHVRDALITTEGAFLARGAVSFEPDPAGASPARRTII
jgi:hypothetical protein